MASNHEEYSNDITLEKLKCSVQICWQPAAKYLRLTLVFMWSSALWEKFDCCFSRAFLPALTKFSISHRGWALGYHFMEFRYYHDIF